MLHATTPAPHPFNPHVARRRCAAAVASATRAARHAAMAGDADALDDHLAELAAPGRRGPLLRHRQDVGARAALARLVRTGACGLELPA